MWERLYEGAGKIGGLAAGAGGSIIASDMGQSVLVQIKGAEEPAVWRDKAGGVEAIAFAPDGKIIAAQPRRNRVVSFAPGRNGKETVRIKSIAASALAVASDGTLYALDTHEGRLYRINAQNTVVTIDFDLPGGGRGMVLSPDQTRLFVIPPASSPLSSGGESPLYLYELNSGGKAARRPFAEFRFAPESACGIAVNSKNRLFIAVQAGLVVCDETGRTLSVIAPPDKNAPVSHIVFGGDQSVLFAASANRIYKQRL